MQKDLDFCSVLQEGITTFSRSDLDQGISPSVPTGDACFCQPICQLNISPNFPDFLAFKNQSHTSSPPPHNNEHPPVELGRLILFFRGTPHPLDRFQVVPNHPVKQG